MTKSARPKLTPALLLLVLIATASRALAADTGSTPTPPPPSTSTTTLNGVTGTDPEPIDPDLVGLILSLLNLA